MESVEVSARFALPPNSKRYCGTRPFAKIFAAYLRKRSTKNYLALEKSLSTFTAHYAYLSLIAAANGKKPFGRGVPEALWLGNWLLGRVKRKDLQGMITQQFCGKGMLSRKKAKELASSIPDGFLPHHSFHILYLHTISGVIEPSSRNADLCRVSWGKVMNVERGAVIVQSQKLVRKNGILKLLPCRKRWLLKCAGIALVQDVKKGDWVASHWGVAVMKITKKQMVQLERITKQNIAAANGMGKH